MDEHKREAPPERSTPAPQRPRGEGQRPAPRNDSVLANLPSTDNWVVKGLIIGPVEPSRRR